MKIKYIFASVASACLLAVGVLGGTPSHIGSANDSVRSAQSSSHHMAKKASVKGKTVAVRATKKDSAKQKQAAADKAKQAQSASASSSSARATSQSQQANAQSQSSASSTTNAQPATNNSSSQNTATNNNGGNQAQQQASQPAPAPTTGFTVGGRTYAIRSFSGSGRVPADSNVYQWAGMSNHYLFERTGVAFGSLASVGVGSTVAVNGHQYTVRQVLANQDNTSSAAYDALMAGKAQWGGISFQTCEATNGYVRLYFAN